MQHPLSLDLRQRIAQAVKEGGRVRAVAARFGVSVATAVRLGQRARADLTMRALAAEICDKGTPISHDAVWRFVRKEGLTVKKRRWLPASGTGRMSRVTAGAGRPTSTRSTRSG